MKNSTVILSKYFAVHAAQRVLTGAILDGLGEEQATKANSELAKASIDRDDNELAKNVKYGEIKEVEGELRSAKRPEKTTCN